MSTHRKLMTGCAVAVLGFGLAACGGGGDNSARDSLQEQLDALQAVYDGEGDLTPEAITGLQTALGAANDRIGSDDDPASLLGMLAAKIAEIGTADDPTSLMGMLADKTAEVTALMTTLGDEDNPDMASVRGMLAARIAEIGTADDPTSLMGRLAAANDRIGTADDPDSLLGMLAAEKQKVTDLEIRIAALEGGTDPVLLTPIQMAAKDASDSAATAETAAVAAADAAEKAAGTFADETMNQAKQATIQTGDANSEDDAEDARTAANTAMAEAKKALDAYNAAVAAGDTTAANLALTDAQTAMRAAMTAQKDAEDAMKEAVADSLVELKIADTVKSVGDTTIDAEASSSVVITAGQTVNTGLQPNGEHPMTMVDPSDGVKGVKGDPTANPNPYVAPVAGAAGKTFPIGKLVDSSDDLARLMIVTSYAGTKTVKVYASDEQIVPTRDSTKANAVVLVPDTDKDPDTDSVVYANLKSVGTYYRAGTTGTISPSGDVVAADAKGVHVYSYVNDQQDIDPTNDVTFYVVRHSTTTTAGGVSTYHYAAAKIHVDVDVNGDGTNQNVEVTAKIPEATAYNHIHFGVWAALGDAEKDGSQEIADLGIGFVQNFSDSGMTGSDMPNNGDATYTGNWVATVQAADEDGNGDISLEHGVASIAADFEDGDIIATLTDLATLEGDIAGNQFSGTKATATGSGLDINADFEGSFSGAFYGAKGAEAGGVFDFESDDGEGGAFRGAFGGKK